MDRRGLLKWLGIGAIAAPVAATTKTAGATVPASVEKAAANGPFRGQMRVIHEHSITTVHDPGHSHCWHGLHTHQQGYWPITVPHYEQWDGTRWVRLA
jgi:hypothetical protein